MKSLAENKPTISSSVQGVYTSGQLIGQLIPINVSEKMMGGMSALLMQLDIVDTDKLGKKISLYVFSGLVNLPSDKTTFDIASPTDALQLRAKIDITSWLSFTGSSVALNTNLSLAIPSGTDRRFYVALVAGESLTVLTAGNYKVVPSYYVD